MMRHDDPVPDVEAGDAGAELDHLSDDFVAEHGPGCGAAGLQLEEIRPTEA